MCDDVIRAMIRIRSCKPHCAHVGFIVASRRVAVVAEHKKTQKHVSHTHTYAYQHKTRLTRRWPQSMHTLAVLIRPDKTRYSRGVTGKTCGGVALKMVKNSRICATTLGSCLRAGLFPPFGWVQNSSEQKHVLPPRAFESLALCSQTAIIVIIIVVLS